MTETACKAPKTKKESSIKEEEILASSSKRPRTAEDFYLFCSFILEYEKYGVPKQEELREQDSGSPLNSTDNEECSRSDSGSDSKDSESSESASPELASNQDWNWNGLHFSEDDSYDLVTCYCAKPFAGRAMIECSKCLTWIHLSCAKIKKNNIPEVFICVKCKSQKCGNIPSHSTVRHKKRVTV